MIVKSNILKLPVLPKSATFLFVAFFSVTSVCEQNPLTLSTATFLLPPGTSGGTNK